MQKGSNNHSQCDIYSGARFVPEKAWHKTITYINAPAVGVIRTKAMTEDLPETLWCIEANIVKARVYGEGGIDSRNGIRLFRGGAKVYIIGAYYGMCESVVLLGHHRKSVRLICSVVKAKHLENFKVKPIYEPKLREMAENRSAERDGAYIPIKSKDEMERLAEGLPLWIKGSSK